jgi:hypothetical protein
VIYDPRCCCKSPPTTNNRLQLPSNPYHITGVLGLKIYSSKRFLHFGVAANNPFIGVADVEGNCKMQCEGNVCIRFRREGSSIANYISSCFPAA